MFSKNGGIMMNAQGKKQNRKKKLVTPTSKNKITNEELLQMLKVRQISLKELKRKGVTEYQLTKLRKFNYKIMEQYDPIQNDIVYYALEKGDDPFVILPETSGSTLKIAKMSDIHLGSNEVDEEELISLLTYLWKSGYRIITLSGDIIDGFNVYRGHIQNISEATLDMQADLVVSILSMFNFLYITNTGNHDASSTKNAGVDVIRLIEQKMLHRGRKFVYLKSYSGYIVYKDVAIQIIHMDGGNNSISETYAGQKMMDNIFKTSAKMGKSNVNAVRIMGKMVPVINVITGHYHSIAKFVYGNVVVESPLSAQHTTDFINRRGIHSKTGARVSELTIDSNKCISEKGAIIFARDTAELYELESLNIKEDYLNVEPQHATKTLKNKQNPKEDLDIIKINKALKLLIRKGFYNKEELGLTQEEINYINETCNYNIYINDETIVFKTDKEETAIIYSPIEQKGLVTYLEISNLLVGSIFFQEEAFRYMLDKAKEAGIRHIHIGGNAVWGIPKKNDADKTKFFSGSQQASELVRILKDYPEFHYYSINGYCENTFIRADEKSRFDPMQYVEETLEKEGIKFTAISASKCDFLIDGIVFRMVNDKKALKNPYTRDYDIVKAQRSLMAKTGNIAKINGVEYNIGAIYYGFVPSTIESHSGGIYVTSTAGPTLDPDNASKIIQANAECAIVRALVDHGEILKFEREIISPK